MKERIKEEIALIKGDSNLKSRLFIITLAAALLVLAVCIRGPEQLGRVISDKDGKAVSIERHSTNTSESYDFVVLIEEGDETISKDVNLTIQAIRKEGGGLGLTEEPSRDDEIEDGLSGIINEIEYSRSKKIKLPDSLNDGTPLTWKANIKRDYSYLILIPAIYVAMIVFVIRASKTNDKEEDAKRRRSILRSLPRFCNQLYLMINAGLILSDAFDTICAGYEANRTCSPFETDLTELQEATDGHRVSTAQVINEYAVKHDVKEMIRIAAILNENEKRGSDVVESLERESRYLWDERKTVAREYGKSIDTKMSYPLGLLLIVLIVITMAPALLNI